MLAFICMYTIKSMKKFFSYFLSFFSFLSLSKKHMSLSISFLHLLHTTFEYFSYLKLNPTKYEIKFKILEKFIRNTLYLSIRLSYETLHIYLNPKIWGKFIKQVFQEKMVEKCIKIRYLATKPSYINKLQHNNKKYIKCYTNINYKID